MDLASKKIGSPKKDPHYWTKCVVPPCFPKVCCPSPQTKGTPPLGVFFAPSLTAYICMVVIYGHAFLSKIEYALVNAYNKSERNAVLHFQRPQPPPPYILEEKWKST